MGIAQIGGEAETPAIVLRNVSKTFKTGDVEINALNEINLHIAAGKFVAVVGSSGCGKSTLLRLLAGLIPATKGEIWVKGKKVQGPDPETGIVFQSPSCSLGGQWSKIFGCLSTFAARSMLQRRAGFRS